MAPIARETTINHLAQFADNQEALEKLTDICKLYDPIGLASKPLFLQMIKETLHDLPKDSLDEITLYEYYIKQSLNRKIEQLDDENLSVSMTALPANLLNILEDIALKLQKSNEDYFCLTRLSTESEKNIAELLWKLSDLQEPGSPGQEIKDTAVEDATARVGVRSLLTRGETDDHKHDWPVDFCHRSVREYFVARGLHRALHNDVKEAERLLSELPLNHEILYFTIELMKRGQITVFEQNLYTIIRTTKNKQIEGGPGGNAATLLFWLNRELPGEDWAGLNLDGADLGGCNLSNKTFFGTSLRYSNLENCNFGNSDFRYSDLTGVRIEETAAVSAVAIHPVTHSVFAAYGDGSFREWSYEDRTGIKSRKIAEDLEGDLSCLCIQDGSALCTITNRDVFFYDIEEGKRLITVARFRLKSDMRRVRVKRDYLLFAFRVSDTFSRVMLVSVLDRKVIASFGVYKLSYCENLDQMAVVFCERKSSLFLKVLDEDAATIMLMESDDIISCLSVFRNEERNDYLVGVGQQNGTVEIWRIVFTENGCVRDLLLRSAIHDGIVTSMAFLDKDRVVTGGIDRKIVIVTFGHDVSGGNSKQEAVFKLSVQCKGMMVTGLRGDRERILLERLISKASGIE